MTREPSPLRLNLLRLIYFLDFTLLGVQVWPVILDATRAWDPLRGVALSFWGALAALCGLGLRYPLSMLPVLLLQLLYKAVWLIAAGLRIDAGAPVAPLAGMVPNMAFGVVVLTAVIPWSHVLSQYVRRPGEPWRRAERSARAGALTVA